MHSSLANEKHVNRNHIALGREQHVRSAFAIQGCTKNGTPYTSNHLEIMTKKKSEFTLTGDAYDLLQRVAQKTGRSEVAVLARALSMYEVVIDQLEKDSSGRKRVDPELAILENGEVKTKIAPAKSSF